MPRTYKTPGEGRGAIARLPETGGAGRTQLPWQPGSARPGAREGGRRSGPLGPRGHGPDHRARALAVPDALGSSGGCHDALLVPGKQHPGLPASPVHPRGIREAGRPAGDRALPHPGPLRGGAGRLPLRSFHVQQHPEPPLYPFGLPSVPRTGLVSKSPFFAPLQTFWAQVSAQGAKPISLAIAAHCSASVALSFFIFERWECTTYWYIFAVCSAFPALTETALFIAVFGLKKKPF